MAVLRQISFVFPRLAAEQKARVTYDNILRLVDDPDVRDVIKFLRYSDMKADTSKIRIVKPFVY